nr:tol-Pal system protein TolA-like [Aegilops tauschii subsp. strangulata]
MALKSAKGKGVAKDAGTVEPPKNSSSVNPEDVDAVIENVAKVAEADAEKIAAEEAAKGAAEDAAKGSAGEAGRAAAEEADKGPAGEAGRAAAEEEEEAAMQASASHAPEVSELRWKLEEKQADASEVVTLKSALAEAKQEAEEERAARLKHESRVEKVQQELKDAISKSFVDLPWSIADAAEFF